MISSAVQVTLGRDLKITQRNLGVGLPLVRMLGPVQFWGGEIVIASEGKEHLQDFIKAAAHETGHRVSGYFISDTADQLRFHMSRLPRREGLDVPAVTSFRLIHRELSSLLEKHGLEHLSTEEAPSAQPMMRVLLGLAEGYHEQRKLDIITKITDGTFGSVEVARAAIAGRIGSLSQFGIDPNLPGSLESLRAVLAETSFTIIHTAAEVSKHLPDRFTVQPADIYAASADYLYQEPAIVIQGDPCEDNFKAICKVANSLHQARFSLEYLHKGEALNVEILSHSSNTAAIAS